MAPPAWAYQVENFCHPPDEELICCICQGVFCDPMQSPCMHVFCKVCILRWFESHCTCPICRTPVERDSLRNVLPLLKNLIARLRIHCHNFSRGCDKVFPLENSESHVKDCAFELVRCANQPCQVTLLRREVEDHQKYRCIYRYASCPGCKLPVLFLNWKYHRCVDDLKKALQEEKNANMSNQETIKNLQRELENYKQRFGETLTTNRISDATRESVTINGAIPNPNGSRQELFTLRNPTMAFILQDRSNQTINLSLSNSSTQRSSIQGDFAIQAGYLNPASYRNRVIGLNFDSADRSNQAFYSNPAYSSNEVDYSNPAGTFNPVGGWYRGTSNQPNNLMELEDDSSDFDNGTDMSREEANHLAVYNTHPFSHDELPIEINFLLSE